MGQVVEEEGKSGGGGGEMWWRRRGKVVEEEGKSGGGGTKKGISRIIIPLLRTIFKAGPSFEFSSGSQSGNNLNSKT
jgi:hypothetical protein